MQVYEDDQRLESATTIGQTQGGPIAIRNQVPALTNVKRWARRTTIQDKLLFAGLVASLGWLGFQFMSAPPQIVKNQPAQFDPNLVQAVSEVEYREFISNVVAFLQDQANVNSVQRAIEYRDSAKDFANQKNNESCFGSRTRNECLASFLQNRAGELEQVVESPGDEVTMRLTKSEARELIRLRVEALLMAVHNSSLRDVPPADSSMIFQIQTAANLIQQKERVSLEGQSREVLEEGF